MRYIFLILILFSIEKAFASIIKTSSNSFSYTNNNSGIREDISVKITGDIDYVAVTRLSNQAISNFNIFIIRSSEGYYYLAYDNSLMSVQMPSNMGLDLSSSCPQSHVGDFSDGSAYFLCSPQHLRAELTARSLPTVIPFGSNQLQKISDSEFFIDPYADTPSHNLIPMSGSLNIIEEIEFGLGD